MQRGSDRRHSRQGGGAVVRFTIIDRRDNLNWRFVLIAENGWIRMTDRAMFTAMPLEAAPLVILSNLLAG